MFISLFRNERDAEARAHETDWRTLAEELTEFERTNCSPCEGHDCRAKSGPAWSPATFRHGKRKAADVDSIALAVFDLDNAPDEVMADLGERLARLRYAYHSTHAGRNEATRMGNYRLIIATSRSMSPSEWAKLYPIIVADYGIPADESCRDAGRLYYLPSCSTTREPLFGINDTEHVIDVDELLSRGALSPPSSAPAAPAVVQPVAVLSEEPTAIDLTAARMALGRVRSPECLPIVHRVLSGRALADTGNRDNSVNRIMSALAMVGVTEAEALALVEPSIIAMDCAPEGQPYWFARATLCFRRALDRKANSDAAREADRTALLNLLGRNVDVPPPDDAWRQGLLFTTDKEGRPAKLSQVEANVELILLNDPNWRNMLRFNLVKKQIDVFGGPCAKAEPSDLEFIAATWFQRSEYAINMKPHTFGPALLRVARLNSYDPLAEYLLGSKWDGVPRADEFLERYLGAPTTPHIRLLSAKWLISTVARALRPGCKVDTALILTGDYGLGKTQFVEVMAGDFYTNSKVDFQSKDSRALASRYWIIEMAELSGMRKADRESIKDWLSTRIDSYRPPYGRVTEDFPRRCVFVGTTNDDEFLAEPNRREWVVQVGKVDLAALRRDRDQIWAEAVARFSAGEPWWLDSSADAMVRAVAREFAAPDQYSEAILDWFLRQPPERRPATVQTRDLAVLALDYTKDRVTVSVMQGIGKALKSTGFVKFRGRKAGQLTWEYRTPKELLEAPQGSRDSYLKAVPSGA